MEFTYQYGNDEEKQNLLNMHNDKFLIAEKNIIEGNFLVFADVKPIETELNELKTLVNDSNLVSLDIQLNLYEEILFLRSDLESLKTNV